eukprot:6467311-Amphidinium_carterae.1
MADRNEDRDRVYRLRKQTLFVLQQQVSLDRQKCSTQFVATGWSRLASTADSTPEQVATELEVRKRTLAAFISTALGPRVTWTATHASRSDRLLPVSIVQLEHRDQVMKVLKAAKAQPCPMLDESGAVQAGRRVAIRPQIALFDRLCTLPIKAAMACLSAHRAEWKEGFRPQWREARVDLDGRTILEWSINTESALLFIRVRDDLVQVLERDLQHHIEKLLGGAGKGTGKGNTKSKFGDGEDTDAHGDVQLEELRLRLSDLSLPGLPFSVEVQPLGMHMRDERASRHREHAPMSTGLPTQALPPMPDLPLLTASPHTQMSNLRADLERQIANTSGAEQAALQIQLQGLAVAHDAWSQYQQQAQAITQQRNAMP